MSTAMTTVQGRESDPDFLAKRVDALNAAIAWVDEHSAGLPVHPGIRSYSHMEAVEVDWHITDRSPEDQKDIAAAIVRVVGGRWDKSVGSDLLFLTHHEPGMRMTIYVGRDAACTRVVTGTREVVIPAMAALPERVEVVEDVEWECGSILAGAAS